MALEIRKLMPYEIDSSMKLAERVFVSQNGKTWPTYMVEYFKTQIINNPSLIAGYKDGNFPAYGAFLQRGMKTAGVMTISSDCSYITLLFVDSSYQKQGIGRKLIDKMLEDHPAVQELKVNAFSAAVPFFRACGFAQAGDVIQTDGMRYTPMRLLRKSEVSK